MPPPTSLAVASSKEMQSRPLTFVNRPTITTTCQSSLPGRPSHAHSHSRNNSHTVAAGSSHHASHRVTRRKSMSCTAANREAVVAVLKAEGTLPLNTVTPRGRAISKSSRSGSPPAAASQALKLSPQLKPNMLSTSSSAIDDDQMSSDETPTSFQKARVRRASDGQPLTKEGRKGNRQELRCQQCGKGYKHGSCLAKHLWEHTPQWSYTSKLLISKHQQVQLLEAASVLVAMNNRASEAGTPPDSAKDFHNSDRESASPAASGYSGHRGGQSSTNTTPPPRSEVFGSTSRTGWHMSKRYSSGSGLTQSLQAAKTATNVAASAPNGLSGFGHFRQVSHDQRPPSSGINKTGRDDRDLAATLEMLSCSFGSNPSRSVGVPLDAPPVPPLPAQFLDQVCLGTSFMTMGSFPTQPESFARGESRVEDIKMEESSEIFVDDDDYDMRSRARSEEDDDGIFGRMEE